MSWPTSRPAARRRPASGGRAGGGTGGRGWRSCASPTCKGAALLLGRTRLDNMKCSSGDGEQLGPLHMTAHPADQRHAGQAHLEREGEGGCHGHEAAANGLLSHGLRDRLGVASGPALASSAICAQSWCLPASTARRSCSRRDPRRASLPPHAAWPYLPQEEAFDSLGKPKHLRQGHAGGEQVGGARQGQHRGQQAVHTRLQAADPAGCTAREWQGGWGGGCWDDLRHEHGIAGKAARCAMHTSEQPAGTAHWLLLRQTAMGKLLKQHTHLKWSGTAPK